MWRRPQNNPAVPIPTYYPDEGAETHSHSPRRRSYVSRGMGSSGNQVHNVSAALSAANTPVFPPTLSSLQKGPLTSTTSFMDPFSEAAYQQWVNTQGLHQQQHTVEPKSIWPSAVTRNISKQSTTDTSIASLPDYLSSTIPQNISSDPMNVSGPSQDDDIQLENLKVPTNTPTTLTDDRNSITGQSDTPPV